MFSPNSEQKKDLKESQSVMTTPYSNTGSLKKLKIKTSMFFSGNFPQTNSGIRRP